MPKIEKYLEYPQDTRWATDEEIMSPLSSTKINITAPPFETAGLILKSDGRTVYVDGMDHHSMILGSTGSGKSRLLCMPMIGIMANAGESFIVTDPKGELFQMTSGTAKEQGYQVVVLNFREVSCGDMWNPLLIPYELYRKGDRDHAMSLLNDFVVTLAEADNTQEQFWSQMAQSLILANILLLFETARREEVNLHSLSRLCLDYGKPRKQNALYRLLEYMNPDSIAAMNYAGVCVDAEKTQSSIMGVVHSILRVFNTQEGLLRMMADSSFDMRSFGKKKTAVYLIVPDEKRTFHFLVSVFTKQCYEMLISEAHKEENMRLPIRVNFVLDEFANLPAIPDMSNMISAARSRNIRFHLVVQSMNQLFSKYGHDAETISGNCENWVYLNSKEYDCLEEISKRCGNLLDNRDQLRPLITPSRLQRLDKARGETLIFHGRQYPYISYLADISRYEFKVYEPIKLQTGQRKPVSVFRADELLRDLSSGKRALLFYDDVPEDNSGFGYEKALKYGSEYSSTGLKTVSRVYEPAEPDFLKDKRRELSCEEKLIQMRLCREKLEKSGDFSRLLYYLLDTHEVMVQIRDKIFSEADHELQVESFEAENVYRNTDLALCCAVLAGDAAGQEQMEEYESWLTELYIKTVRDISDQKQTLLFFPADSVRLNAVAAAGVAAAFHEIRNHRYACADIVLSYVGDYRDCFFSYPGLAALLHDLQTFIRMIYEKKEECLIQDCMRKLKKSVSFEKKEKPAVGMYLYRKKPESELDQWLMSSVLQYCKYEQEEFQKYMMRIDGGIGCLK